MRKPIRLPDFQNVVQNGRMTLNLPINTTYDKILFKIEGTSIDKTMFTQLEVKANGNTFQEYPNGLDDLDAINRHYGRNVGDAQWAVLHFVRDELREFGAADVHDSKLMGFGTKNLRSATIEMTTVGAPADVAITAYSLESEAQPMGLVTKVRPLAMTVGAGETDISTIMTGSALMAAMHLDKTANDITKVRLYDGSRMVIDTIETEAIDQINKEHGRDVSGDPVVVDFITDNDYRQALPGQFFRDLRFKVTCTTSGTINGLIEYFDAREGV